MELFSFIYKYFKRWFTESWHEPMASFISSPAVFKVLFNKNSSNFEDSKANPLVKHIEIVRDIMNDITKSKVILNLYFFYSVMSG